MFEKWWACEWQKRMRALVLTLKNNGGWENLRYIANGEERSLFAKSLCEKGGKSWAMRRCIVLIGLNWVKSLLKNNFCTKSNWFDPKNQIKPPKIKKTYFLNAPMIDMFEGFLGRSGVHALHWWSVWSTSLIDLHGDPAHRAECSGCTFDRPSQSTCGSIQAAWQNIPDIHLIDQSDRPVDRSYVHSTLSWVFLTSNHHSMTP